MALRQSMYKHVSEAGQENAHASEKLAHGGATYEVVRHRALCDISNKIVPRGEITKKVVPPGEITKKVVPPSEITKKVVPPGEITKKVVPPGEITKKVVPLGEIKKVVPQGLEARLSIQEVIKKAVTGKPAKVVPHVKPSLSKVDPKPESKENISNAISLPPPPEASFKVENGSYSSQFLNDLDIDKNDGSDIMLLSYYVCDIYAYLRELEAKEPVKPNYLLGHRLTGNMRAVLVDWLVDVTNQFRFHQETLYLSVSIIDRFLQKVWNIQSKKLQLVGVAAMSLAAKYEEMSTPYINEYVYICDNTYLREEIVQMEYYIARSLDCSFGRPVAPHFLRRFSKASNSEAVIHSLAKYFMELSLIEYGMCHFSPSKIAAAASFLAQWLMNNGDKSVWTPTLIYHSTYTYSDIVPVARRMAVAAVNADTSKCKAVYKKYSKSKLLKVSVLPELKSSVLKMLIKSPSSLTLS